MVQNICRMKVQLSCTLISPWLEQFHYIGRATSLLPRSSSLPLVEHISGLRSWLWSASNCCRRISCTWYWASRTFSWGHQHMVSTVLSATQEIQVVGTATVSWDPCLFNLVTHISHLGDWKSGGENLQIKKSAQVILRPPVPKINHRLRQSHTIIQDLHDAHSTFLQTSVVMHPFPLSTTFPPCVVLRIPA